MQQTLSIPRRQYEAMLKQLRRAYPLEACGLLAGSDGRVMRVYAVENALHSRSEYEMEPRQQVEAMLALEEAGWELLAIYHSHPDGPQTPSPTDVARANYPQAAQVIVSLADREQPVARAFTIAEGKVDEISLRIV
jgi:proteasome lid subunit RPN8/RPN11